MYNKTDIFGKKKGGYAVANPLYTLLYIDVLVFVQLDVEYFIVAT